MGKTTMSTREANELEGTSSEQACSEGEHDRIHIYINNLFIIIITLMGEGST